jgi:serine protease Do
VLIASNARAIDIANSNDVTVLDTAIAIGNPANNGLSATVGYINVDSEEIVVPFEVDGETKGVELRVMRTDAAVNSGNSGGGLFNEKGELIGIVNAKSADTAKENIGYAIPSNVAIAIADNAIDAANGSVWRCMLGIEVGVKEYSTEYDKESGKIKKIEEVVVLSAGEAVRGVLEVGDVINSISINGKTMEVTRVYHVVDYMLNARVGDTVKFSVTRGEETVDEAIVIDENMAKPWRIAKDYFVK